MTRIGLLTEDGALQQLLVSTLDEGYSVVCSNSEDEFKAWIDDAAFDVAILDLPATAGKAKNRTDCCRRIAARKAPAILLADDALRSQALELTKHGAFGVCHRPPSARELKTMLNRASESLLPRRKALNAQPQVEIKIGCDRLIGSSPQIRQVHHLIRRVADLNASVLITGESGTGKELIARAIHDLGVRAGKPFVAVSCGAIPEPLIEAELFGHEKGAFTGTVGAREGYFEQVNDGTLFLDEIGDLSLYTQVKLLRVLQQMEFSRLGSNRLIPLKARLIFATHQDLSKLVAEGKFRQDLYYRINVMRINSPALADHAEDIPQIAMHYLQHYSSQFQKPVDTISPDAMAMLQSYTWPGNVRELENTIQRAIILAHTTTLRPEDLPLNLHADKVIDIGDYNPDGSFERQLRDYKVKLAVDAVRDNNGNKTLAARSLGISRAYLHRLIRMAEPEMGFEPESVRSTSTSASASA